MLSQLRTTHQERIQKAARHSYSILTGERSGLTGNKYETEIFNLIRAVFPESHQLGREGRAEPDSFVTLHDYRTAQSASEPQMWNWTYDAKLSELANGYRLDRDERRKAKEYIEKFRRNRTALMGDRRLQAHVFIANNISDSKMKGMAKYLYGPDGLSKSAREMKLAFMDEQYILALYEWSQQNQAEWRQRRVFVGELLIQQFERDDKYRHLKSEDAKRLTDKLMAYQIVGGRISRDVLEASLEEVAI